MKSKANSKRIIPEAAVPIDRHWATAWNFRNRLKTETNHAARARLEILVAVYERMWG